MKIRGIDNMTPDQVYQEIQRGAKFVVFQYTISILVMTFKRPSEIFFVRPGEKATSHGVPYTLLSLFLGWWGIPWGPIWTISTIWTNSKGGKDVTDKLMPLLVQNPTAELPGGFIV